MCGNECVKRIMDFSLAVMILVLLFPVFPILWIWIAVRMGRPVLFRQVRPGKNGKPFVLYKFRTMKDLRDDSGQMLPDGERLTKFGIFLRSTSLDELPEIINVLRGDMSFVGPRPLLMEYLPLYDSHQKKRHLVKPGITGWAQVNGRNTIDWEEKFDLDVWYVQNRSIRLDIEILIRTVIEVFRRTGIDSKQGGIMPKFTGSGHVEKPMEGDPE